MEKQWFLFHDGDVSGPYSTETVLERMKTNLSLTSTLVWWRGQAEWMPLQIWHAQLPQIIASQNENVRDDEWYLYEGTRQLGPMSRSQMITYLSQKITVNGVSVWHQSYNDWKTIFECNDILAEVGVLTRQHPRVPIVGSAVVQFAGLTLPLELSSIAEGGVSVKNGRNLAPGERVLLTIKSPLLVSPITTTAHVVFRSENGSSGLRFESLPGELKSIIGDYIRNQKGSERGTEPHSNSFDTENEITQVTSLVEEEVRDIPVEQLWFVNRMGQEQGPMPKSELLEILAGLEDKTIVRISNTVSNIWKGPFDFEEVVEALGLSRRVQTRAPLVGELVIIQDRKNYFYEVTSVSENGLGVRGEIPLQHGSIFEAQLTSPILDGPVKATLEVLYCSSGGNCGLRFVEIPKVEHGKVQGYLSMFKKSMDTGSTAFMPSAS